jgi:pyrimidine-nucleoside phosphorylase
MDAPKTDSRFLSALFRNPSDDDIRTVITTVASQFPRDATVAAELATLLAASGERLSVHGAVVADVASTGGPASLSTLLPPLLLRAAGAIVPKLGVPGRPAGGIDCLAQIPGYRTELSLREIEKIVNGSGYAHFLAKGEMAPLDGRMFKLRQAMNAQTVPTLVTSSLLSKKLAVGVKYAGLDVRVAPHGNFGADRGTAVANALLFLGAARALGIDASPVLTDARHPYQPYLGKRESLLALDDIFRGACSPWLGGHVETCRALALASLPADLRAKVANVSSADLRQHFDDNLAAQGADPADFDAVVRDTRREHTRHVLAAHDGFCFYRLDLLRERLVEWQGMFRSERAPFPDPVGLVLLVLPGQWVSGGTPIATVRAPESLVPDVIHSLGAIIGTPSRLPTGPNFEAIDG